MEEGCGSWHPQQDLNWQSPKLNYLRDHQELGQPNGISACVNIHANVISTNQTSPTTYAFSDLPHLQPAQPNEPHGRFYSFPHFREAFEPNAGPRSDQKRFLVFDQSGDQTTLIYSSVIRNPVQPLISWSPKPLNAYNLTGEEDPGSKMPNYLPGPIPSDESNENHRTDAESGLQEDSEELNALLYSDDDDGYDTEDDEETSTGHSPSTMTVNDNREWFEGCAAEEVASSDGTTKRRKLSGGEFDVPSLVGTASSVKTKGYIELNDDAESSCGDSPDVWPEKSVTFSGNKRMRKDRIRETVSILQSIIPNGKGKDAVVVLDEAIDYLKSLKLKAIALGLKTPCEA